MLQGRPNKTADLNQLLEPTQTCGGNLFDYFAPMHPLRILGKGAFGTVELYQVLPAAREFFTKKNFEVPDSVAIKELTYNRQNNVKSIASEIKTLSQLDRHPNIIQYYGCFINTDNQAYLVMEYFDGEELTTVGDSATGLNDLEKISLLKDLAECIRYLHNNDIMHRDIKPQNIMIKKSVSKLTVKILDYGISCNLKTPDDKKCTSVTGTPYYMSPYVWKGHPTINDLIRSDWWALGVVIYELYTGERLYTGRLRSQILDHDFEKIHFNEDFPREINTLLRGLLTNSPDDQWSADKIINYINEQEAKLKKIHAGPSLIQRNLGRKMSLQQFKEYKRRQQAQTPRRQQAQTPRRQPLSQQQIPDLEFTKTEYQLSPSDIRKKQLGFSPRYIDRKRKAAIKDQAMKNRGRIGVQVLARTKK